MCIVELLFQSICKFRRSITQFTLGSSQQAERGEALSSTKENSHLKYEVGRFPKSTSPQVHCLGTLGAWQLSSCPAASLTSLGLTSTPWQVILASSPGLTTPFRWNNIIGLRHLDFVSIFWKLTSSWFTCFLNYVFPMHLDGTAQSFPALPGSFTLSLELPCGSSSPHILLLTFCSHWLVIFISFWKTHNLPVKSHPRQLPHLPSLLCCPPLKRKKSFNQYLLGCLADPSPPGRLQLINFWRYPQLPIEPIAACCHHFFLTSVFNISPHFYPATQQRHHNCTLDLVIIQAVHNYTFLKSPQRNPFKWR